MNRKILKGLFLIKDMASKVLRPMTWNLSCSLGFTVIKYIASH